VSAELPGDLSGEARRSRGQGGCRHCGKRM